MFDWSMKILWLTPDVKFWNLLLVSIKMTAKKYERPQFVTIKQPIVWWEDTEIVNLSSSRSRKCWGCWYTSTGLVLHLDIITHRRSANTGELIETARTMKYLRKNFDFRNQHCIDWEQRTQHPGWLPVDTSMMSAFDSDISLPGGSNSSKPAHFHRILKYWKMKSEVSGRSGELDGAETESSRPKSVLSSKIEIQ